MYRHIKDYVLKYTDVDAYDNLKLSSLLSFLEESACLSAEELNFGYNKLAPLNYGFILVNIYIEFVKNIKLADNLTIHTWPLRPSRAIFLRDSEIFVDGKMVGRVTARWCMIDTNSYAILPSSAYFKEEDFVGYNTERSIEFSNWKIPRISDGQSVYSKQITYSDYDHYFHVNNTKYADFLMDVFSVEELKGKRIKSVRITYVKQCKEGEVICLSRSGNCGRYLVEGSVDGELRVQMEICFDED